MEINNWHDWLRLAAFFVSLYSFAMLVYRYQTGGGKNWNVKTKDYWFALVMWSLSGCAFTIQGIALDRPFTPGFVFLIAAILVTGKGIRRKGDWGAHAHTSP